jgi:hypothetical protein
MARNHMSAWSVVAGRKLKPDRGRVGRTLRVLDGAATAWPT